MSRDLNQLNPYVKELAVKLISECKNQGIEIIITETYRSIEEQNRLYAQGRTITGKIVTNAKGWYSIHNYGYAFDIAVKVDGLITWEGSYYDKVGQIGKSLGLEWGGDFKSIVDKPHFQYTQGLTITDFRNGKYPCFVQNIQTQNIQTSTGMESINGRIDNMKIIDVQKLCNKLGITDHEGKPLVEDNINGKRTESARVKLKEIISYIIK